MHWLLVPRYDLMMTVTDRIPSYALATFSAPSSWEERCCVLEI